MKQPGVIILPPPPYKWDASPALNLPYPLTHLCGVKHCESVLPKNTIHVHKKKLTNKNKDL